jgi:hypothetical protein
MIEERFSVDAPFWLCAPQMFVESEKNTLLSTERITGKLTGGTDFP